MQRPVANPAPALPRRPELLSLVARVSVEEFGPAMAAALSERIE